MDGGGDEGDPLDIGDIWSDEEGVEDGPRPTHDGGMDTIALDDGAIVVPLLAQRGSHPRARHHAGTQTVHCIVNIQNDIQMHVSILRSGSTCSCMFSFMFTAW